MLQPSGLDTILVPGVHRSGTSALAGTLCLLGINLGEHLGEPAADNPKGFIGISGSPACIWPYSSPWGWPGTSLPSTLPLDWPESVPLPELRGPLANIARAFVDQGRPWCLKTPRKIASCNQGNL